MVEVKVRIEEFGQPRNIAFLERVHYRDKIKWWIIKRIKTVKQ